MKLIITKQIVSEVLQVAIGYDEKEFDVFISEAQDFDLKPLLCEEFYYELVEKHNSDQSWIKIMKGGEYSYNDNTYFFRGFNDIMAYFTYARFIRKSNNVSTSHGFVTKTTPHSQPLPTEEKNNMYYKYIKDANTIFKDIKIFFDRNIKGYDSWNSCREICKQNTAITFKTKVIK